MGVDIKITILQNGVNYYVTKLAQVDEAGRRGLRGN